MTPELVTCSAKYLAEIFNVTQRNINHYVEVGMPIYKRGKAGRQHTFCFPWAFYWYAGWSACRTWEKPLPAPLETVLIGFATDHDYPGFSFIEWMQRAKELATDMGYDKRAFDAAMLHIITHNLIRSRR